MFWRRTSRYEPVCSLYVHDEVRSKVRGVVVVVAQDPRLKVPCNFDAGAAAEEAEEAEEESLLGRLHDTVLSQYD